MRVSWGYLILELLICNARLLALDSGRESLSDVLVREDKIVSICPAGAGQRESRRVVQADGMYLLPGFIDFHTHLFRHGSTFGMDADKLLTAGVTTAVDMGTAGWVNYPALYQCDLSGKKLRLFSYLNISPVGQPGKGINEPLDDSVLDIGKMRELIEEYPKQICGIKVRISRSIVKELGLTPLKRAVEFGEQLGLPVCVHTTDPPEGAEQVAKLLRAGDVYSHVYHNKGSTILDQNGIVRSGLIDARERGVLMEVGNGRVNFSFPVAEKAAACHFWPDIISSDSTPATFHKEPAMWDLAAVMSKFLFLGMPLTEVIRAVTETPAKQLGLADKIGKVEPGYQADLILCRLKYGDVLFQDSDGNQRQGSQSIVPVTTIRSGQIAYQAD